MSSIENSNVRVRTDISATSAKISDLLKLSVVPNINTTPVWPPGSLVMDGTSKELFYSTGGVWRQITSSDLYSPDVDYIIVGGGTAGLSAAWALTNDLSTNVLVVEAGENLNNDPLVLDPTVLSAEALTFDPKYAEVNVTTSHAIYSEGKLLGGGSAHSGLQAVRSTPDIYNNWAVLSGDSRWSYANMLNLFKSQETYNPNGTVPDPAQRGTTGNLHITQQAPLSANAFAIAMGVGLGVPQISDYNDHFLIAPGVYANTIGIAANQDWITAPPGSVRSFSGNSYLTGISSVGIPSIVDSNLNGIGGRKLAVRVKSSVSRVIFSNTTAIGVEIIVTEGTSNKVQLAFATKGVILSAGSFHSPAILQRSGVGKSSDLTPLGINVIIDSPNVGYNMINHYGPQALMQLLVAPPPPLKLNMAFTDLSLGGYMPADGSRRIQTDFLFPGGALFPSDIISTLNIGATPNVFVSGWMLRPQSRGSVKIVSTSPETRPKIDLGDFTDDLSPTPWLNVGSDAYVAVSYLKTIQNIAVAQGGGPANVLFPPNSHYPAPWGPAPDDSKLYDAARKVTSDTYHCVGTCRMGTNISNGVVDGGLKVFGAEKLYIADDSIQPEITTGNTAYPAFFIGLQLAKFLGAVLP